MDVPRVFLSTLSLANTYIYDFSNYLHLFSIIITFFSCAWTCILGISSMIYSRVFCFFFVSPEIYLILLSRGGWAGQVYRHPFLLHSVFDIFYLLPDLWAGYMPLCLQCKGELLERERLADENEWQSSINFALEVDRVGRGIKLFFGIRNIHAENTMNLLLPLKCSQRASSFPLTSVPPWY